MPVSQLSTDPIKAYHSINKVNFGKLENLEVTIAFANLQIVMRGKTHLS